MEASVAPAITPAADPAVRRSGIGSSDAPVVVGLSSYSTPADLFLEKRGLADREVPPRVQEAAEWGIIMEPIILREYAKRQDTHVLGRNERGRPTIWMPNGTARPVHEDGTWVDIGPDSAIHRIPEPVYEAIAGTARHPDREWMMFHPDGFAMEIMTEEPLPGAADMTVTALLEAKTASEWLAGEWGAEETDQVPAAYLIQVQHGAEIVRGILGRAVPIRIPVVLGGNRYRIHRLELHEDLVADIVALEEEFWTAVQEGDQPEPEPDARGLDTLKRLYPKEDPDSERAIPFDHPLHETAVELARVTKEIKELEARKAALNVEIQKAMGTTRKLVGDGWSYTWTETRGRVSKSAVIEELADIAGLDDEDLETIEERHRGEPQRTPYPYLRNL